MPKELTDEYVAFAVQFAQAHEEHTKGGKDYATEMVQMLIQNPKWVQQFHKHGSDAEKIGIPTETYVQGLLNAAAAAAAAAPSTEKRARADTAGNTAGRTKTADDEMGDDSEEEGKLSEGEKVLGLIGRLQTVALAQAEILSRLDAQVQGVLLVKKKETSMGFFYGLVTEELKPIAAESKEIGKVWSAGPTVGIEARTFWGTQSLFMQLRTAFEGTGAMVLRSGGPFRRMIEVPVMRAFKVLVDAGIQKEQIGTRWPMSTTHPGWSIEIGGTTVISTQLLKGEFLVNCVVAHRVGRIRGPQFVARFREALDELTTMFEYEFEVAGEGLVLEAVGKQRKGGAPAPAGSASSGARGR